MSFDPLKPYHKRDAWMVAQRFKVLRFANKQVLEDPQSVLEQIATHCIESPDPRGEGLGLRDASKHSVPLPLGEGGAKRRVRVSWVKKSSTI